MANIVRLVSGGTVQVRTGVLQGIGPQGPRGLTGPQGVEGPQGPQGEVGPMGGILAVGSFFTVASTQSIGISADTLISFANVDHDDINAHTSSTLFTLIDAGDYMFNVWVRFDAPAGASAGARHLILNRYSNGNTVLAQNTGNGSTTGPTYVNISFPVRAIANETFRVLVNQGDDESVGVSAGGLAINRIGSGAQGLVGPAGPQGPTGVTGPAGPTGPPGVGGGPYSTYGSLHP